MTKFKMVSRLGMLCGALALVGLTAGCPFINDPCNGFTVVADDDPCTTDSCDVVNGVATSVHTPITNCCEAAADCADDDFCTIDACSNINATTGVGTCTHTGVGQNCCNDTCDCELTEVCTDHLCVPGTRTGNENCNDNTNGNDNGNTNGNDNGNTNGNDNGNGGDAAAGQAYYTAHGCAGCHGADASGGVGPNIQGKTAAEITETLTGGSHPITVDITEQEAADLAAYLATF